MSRIDRMNRLRRALPFLTWPRPDAALMRGELMAGLTVGLMIIPQGVAYAALAGMPLVTGIYASLLPALVAVLFGASPRLSVGPTALTCLLVGASLAPLATAGSPEWVMLAAWLALLCGALQVLLGLVRFGWLLNLVNSPVLMAFTQAAALLIVASQLPPLLGATGWPDLFADLQLPIGFSPNTDRVMLCGSMAMIKETGELLETYGLKEGSNAEPGDYVLERAFVG